MSSNKEEIYTLPAWLNKEFLTKVLCNCENSTEVQVKHFEIVSETPKPIPHGSLVFKTIVNYQLENVNKSKTMTVKAMPESEELIREFMGGAYFFDTEFGMHTDVIPKLEHILRETGDDTALCRRCLYHTSSPRKVFVLEDLEPEGYCFPINRDMTLEEVKTAYMKLAKWHAVSHKLSLENPSYFDNYRYDFLSVPGIADKDFATGGIDLFIELLDSVPSLNEYKPYFHAMRGDLIKNYIAVSEEYRRNPQKDTIYVLCHGDYNFKNFMLKYNPETGQLEDVLLMNLGVSHMGAIATDLIYATFMLLDPKLREDHRDEIFYFYMTTFVQTLKKIGFTGHLPKIAEIRSQIRQRKHIEFYLLTTIRPLLYAWFENGNNQEQFINSTDYRRQFYRRQKYIDELHMVLPRLLYTGLLEN